MKPATKKQLGILSDDLFSDFDFECPENITKEDAQKLIEKLSQKQEEKFRAIIGKVIDPGSLIIIEAMINTPQSWKTKIASEKQMDYLHGLGLKIIQENISKHQARVLIDALSNKQEAVFEEHFKKITGEEINASEYKLKQNIKEGWERGTATVGQYNQMEKLGCTDIGEVTKDQATLLLETLKAQKKEAPTDKQLDFLYNLGYENTEGLTREEASIKIDEFKNKASEKQIDYLVDLGYKGPKNISKEMASEIIEDLKNKNQLTVREKIHLIGWVSLGIGIMPFIIDTGKGAWQTPFIAIGVLIIIGIMKNK